VNSPPLSRDRRYKVVGGRRLGTVTTAREACLSTVSSRRFRISAKLCPSEADRASGRPLVTLGGGPIRASGRSQSDPITGISCSSPIAARVLFCRVGIHTDPLPYPVLKALGFGWILRPSFFDFSSVITWTSTDSCLSGINWSMRMIQLIRGVFARRLLHRHRKSILAVSSLRWNRMVLVQRVLCM